MAYVAPPEFLRQLSLYREMVIPYLRINARAREPRRYLYDLIQSHLEKSGKGLRPALCLATCEAWGGTAQDAVTTAAALELLHNAFLVHDDIEDGSEYRRGEPTMYRQYDIPLAINAGDAMQALSLRMVRDNSGALGPALTFRLLDEFDHMLSESLEGQALEMGWIRDNLSDISVQDYLRMALKKTCWYSFIHPCRIGALIAEPQRTDLDRFNAFGMLAGIAFQIQDDVLNLAGVRNVYGKEIAGDLWEGKRTLMLVHLQNTLTAGEGQRLRGILAKSRGARAAHDVRWIAERMQACGSIEYARAAARQFATAAERAFEAAFADRVTDSSSFLRAFVRFLVEREV
jgi:geranylgeranyl diphosphate synthase, type II